MFGVVLCFHHSVSGAIVLVVGCLNQELQALLTPGLLCQHVSPVLFLGGVRLTPDAGRVASDIFSFS